MKTIRILLLVSMVLFAFSCEKSNDLTEIDETQIIESSKSVFDAVESGVDMSTYNQPAAETPKPNSAVVRKVAGLSFYSDRGTFDGTCPDLPTEDFEKGLDFSVFPSPLDSSSDNAGFSPGDILPGVSFSVTGTQENNASALIIYSSFSATKALISNFFVNNLVIDFTSGDVDSAGMDLTSVFSASDFIIEIYGSSGLLGSTEMYVTTDTFFGVVANEPITQISITSLSGQAETIDNLSFGSCDSDGDGCRDIEDPHPNSDQTATVVIDGCDSGIANVFPVACSTMSDLIADCAANAANHDEFVSCVAALTNAWKAEGLITGKQKGKIQSCAGMSSLPMTE